MLFMQIGSTRASHRFNANNKKIRVQPLHVRLQNKNKQNSFTNAIPTNRWELLGNACVCCSLAWFRHAAAESQVAGSRSSDGGDGGDGGDERKDTHVCKMHTQILAQNPSRLLFAVYHSFVTRSRSPDNAYTHSTGGCCGHRHCDTELHERCILCGLSSAFSV